jgi:nucleoside-diphosphate-sugar epimerase
VNVLVTGAAGYIGFVCAEVLIERGMHVTALETELLLSLEGNENILTAIKPTQPSNYPRG